MEYVTRPVFGRDLEAAQQIWSGAGVMEAAGSFVLLTYFAIPALLEVRPAGGSTREAVDGRRERDFLQAMLGLGGPFRGGIADPGVRAWARSLAEDHRGFPGMHGGRMDFIAGLLALAPLLVSAQPEDEAYWRYMQHLAALWGCELPSRAQTEATCVRFTADRAARSDMGSGLIAAFGVRHPEHVRRAVPVLFPPARRVVQDALG